MGIFSGLFGGGVTGASEQGLAAQMQANDTTAKYINQQQGVARNDLQAGLQPQVNALQSGASQAQNQLNPYAQQGSQALNLMGAYSGAQGADAQQNAYNNFNASPGQSWLQQQAEQGLLRNQAAMGGLGGGNVRQELQRQAMGMAQQDFGNQYNRLAQLGTMGQEAAVQQAGLSQQAGQNLAGVYGQNATNLANVATGAAGQMTNLKALPNLVRDPGNINEVGQGIAGLTGALEFGFGEGAFDGGLWGVGKKLLGIGGGTAAAGTAGGALTGGGLAGIGASGGGA